MLLITPKSEHKSTAEHKETTMTIIRFEYKTNYHMPATGGLVFMPHRKHAANDTEVLPKPFHKTLVDGVAEADLEPTGDDWVWSVSLGNDTRFYAIPDHPGIINHTDLIPIAPSTLDRKIEPSWWAELRQLQTFITDYITESQDNVTQAIDTVNSVHNTLKNAVSDAQRHESVAGAYSRQAQASSEQAWEASKGPDGAADRAQAEADRAETYRNEANTHRQNASNSATTATNARNDAQTARSETITARDTTITARDDALRYRNESRDARDEAQAAHDGMVINGTVVDDNLILSTVNGATIDAGNVRGPKGDPGESPLPGEWQELKLLNGWTNHTTATVPLQYRINNSNIEIIGELNATNATDFSIASTGITTTMRTYHPTFGISTQGPIAQLSHEGILRITEHNNVDRIIINIRTPINPPTP